MNKIICPLKPQMQGTAVADLQTALKLLLDNGLLLKDDAESHQELPGKLKEGRAA